MENFNYEKVYELARKFARGYSKEIIVQDMTRESIIDENGVEYPCVPLKFLAKGNNELYDRLLASGNCTKMDGYVEKGKRMRRILLWIERNCKDLHFIK